MPENEIMFRFNQIELENSKNKNFKAGILKGLMAIQQYYLGKGDYTVALNYGEGTKENAIKLGDNKAFSSIYTYGDNICNVRYV